MPRTPNHKYDWDGYPMVAAVRQARFQPGQKSGLLTAERYNGKVYVQRPDETPRQFWTRVHAEVCTTCSACGQTVCKEAV